MSESDINSSQQASVSKIWEHLLSKFILTAKSEHKKPVIVALARKMPRLMEFYGTKDKGRSSIMSSLFSEKEDGGSDVELITEHAVSSYLKNIKDVKEKVSVLVLDDFIVYGTSAEATAENIFITTGIRPSILSLKRKQRLKPFLYGNLENCEELIDPEVPKFTTDNSYKILSLLKPIDLEYTILSIPVDGGEIMGNWAGFLEKVKSIFTEERGFDVYDVEHRIPEGLDFAGSREIYNISICLKERNPYKKNNDFTKLRIYVGEREASVACYAPNIIWENSLLKESKLFVDTLLKDCWTDVIEAIDRPVAEPVDAGSEVLTQILEEGYRASAQLSKVVWANYLSSFACVSGMKGLLSELFGNVEVGLNVQDICYLVGPDLAQGIREKLKGIYDSGVPTGFDNSETVSVCKDALIPMRFKELYDKAVVSQLDYSNDVREALSLIFTNLHYNIGLFNKREEGENPSMIERFKFGESYESLLEKLRPKFFFPKKGELELRIYKWIDEKIDMGIVVPKYEPSVDEYGRTYWRRYFRAGENEDTYIKLARVCLQEIKECQEYKNKGAIKFEDFVNVVFPNIIKKNEGRPDMLQLDRFAAVAENYNWLMESDRERGTERMLWVFLVNIPVLKPLSMNLEGDYVIRDNSITDSLLQGLPF